ncbi:MAG: hypothetical protein M8353_03585 [ANME-2 cluster archaeon]|nr:hypothetical protein [ANME-2 cluster archaeon]
MTQGCPHISGVWCKLDPKFYKPKPDELETYCSNSDNYINCPVYEKFANMEGCACS